MLCAVMETCPAFGGAFKSANLDALRACEALKVEWDMGAVSRFSTDGYAAQVAAKGKGKADGDIVRTGDVGRL